MFCETFPQKRPTYNLETELAYMNLKMLSTMELNFYFYWLDYVELG